MKKKLLSVIAAPLMAVSCASPDYMGIDLRPGKASPDLQELARSAYAGSRDARYCLAQRFERGDGVERDPKRASSLTRSAARGRSGPLWMNVPSVGTTPRHLELLDRPTRSSRAVGEVPAFTTEAQMTQGQGNSLGSAERNTFDCSRPKRNLAAKYAPPSAESPASSSLSTQADPERSPFSMDRIVAAAITNGRFPNNIEYVEVSCALTLSGLVGPIEAVEAACPRSLLRRIADIKPDASDLDNGYYVSCSASGHFLADPQSSERTFGHGPDPLGWDRGAIERDYDDRVVHVQFDGPRRCATRVIVVMKESG